VGWKHEKLEEIAEKSGGLSENQCGMETKGHISGNGCFELVEREPMWDGNVIGGLHDDDILVEREPMWDGNWYSNVLARISRRVEREPMWDGNSIRGINI